MSRVKRGNVAKKYRKKILKFNKGFVGSHSRIFRIANQQSMKAFRYAYYDRRKQKRNFRKLWISRINSYTRLKNYRYNEFMHNLRLSSILINRKMLAQLCFSDVHTLNILLKRMQTRFS